MSKKEKILYWLPRILGILFVLFISVFALDVFGEGYSPHELAVALFMHLVPTFLVLIALLIGWKWDLIGGILFFLLGGFYVWMAWGEFIGILIVAGPVFLIGLLFFLNKKYG